MKLQSKEQKTVRLHIGIMVIAVLVVYAKVFGAGFMSWDDIDYIFNTPDIRSINFVSFKNWWTEYYIGNYQPLPVFTYAIDFLIGGEEPFIYHLTNVLWHIADVLLLYLCLKRLQGDLYIALFVALLFALHPTQTESVSWVAARNKVMNAFFFLSVVYIYIGYVRQHSNKKLIWIYLCGIAAYLCKLTAVTLPFALLAVDIWMNRPMKNKKVWLEKLPLILLAIPVGIITLQAQEKVEFLNLHPEFTFLHTIVFAGYAYVQYLINLFIPINLSVLYPYPTEIGAIHVLYTLVALGVVLLGVIAYKKKWNVLAGGILFYTANIAIVLQFVQFGEVLMADRYLYIACIGIWYPLFFYLYKYLLSKQSLRIALSAVAILCICYAASAFVRNDIWLSELNFWQSVTKNFPESSIAQSSLGGVYMRRGMMQEAMTHVDAAIKYDKNNYKAWHNKGVLLFRQGKVNDALSALNVAISIREYPKAYFSRALLHQQMGSFAEAMIDVEKVLKAEPKNARAHYIKADCLEQRGEGIASIAEYSLAIQYDAQEPLFYLRRGLAKAKIGKANEALNDLNKAIDLKEGYSEALYWRGMVKYRSGNDPCDDLRSALTSAKKGNNLQLQQQVQTVISELCAIK